MLPPFMPRRFQIMQFKVICKPTYSLQYVWKEQKRSFFYVKIVLANSGVSPS